MTFLNLPAYSRAFRAYLRRGIPIGLSLKMEAEQATNQYIWRTAGDGKVRAEHARNEGKFFSWDAPPPTGHPGEAFGCRCTAEPYIENESEFANQEIINRFIDDPEKWTTLRFLQHAYDGDGAAVTLQETGHLSGVIDYYFHEIFKDGADTYSRLNSQIIGEARLSPDGNFIYEFINSYKEFKQYLFAFGGTTVSGEFYGTVRRHDGMIQIEGTTYFHFEDVFTDIVDARQSITTGTSDPEASFPALVAATDGGGTYFPITGIWQASFKAEVKLNKEESRYI